MKKVKDGFFVPSRDMKILFWFLEEWILSQPSQPFKTAADLSAKRIRAEYREIRDQVEEPS